jgi:hypothetical protein
MPPLPIAAIRALDECLKAELQNPDDEDNVHRMYSYHKIVCGWLDSLSPALRSRTTIAWTSRPQRTVPLTEDDVRVLTVRAVD